MLSGENNKMQPRNFESKTEETDDFLLKKFALTDNNWNFSEQYFFAVSGLGYDLSSVLVASSPNGGPIALTIDKTLTSPYNDPTLKEWIYIHDNMGNILSRYKVNPDEVIVGLGF